MIMELVIISSKTQPQFDFKNSQKFTINRVQLQAPTDPAVPVLMKMMAENFIYPIQKFQSRIRKIRKFREFLLFWLVEISGGTIQLVMRLIPGLVVPSVCGTLRYASLHILGLERFHQRSIVSDYSCIKI